jgi:hypothetical protein
LRDACPNLNVVCDVSRRKKDLTVAQKDLGQHHVVLLSPAEEGGSVSRPLETWHRVSGLFLLDSGLDDSPLNTKRESIALSLGWLESQPYAMI